MSQTAVVILNYNGKDFLNKFLPSVINYNTGYQVFVIDNGSTDDSLSFLERQFSDVKVIALEKNYGYTGGYNRGLKLIDSDYFVLMNSDIEVTENWFTSLENKIKIDPKIAAVQPKVKSYQDKNLFEYAGASGGYIDWLGYPFCRGRIFDTLEEDHHQYDESVEIFWSTGACMLIKSEYFFEVGGFDEDFFVHMEEIDLCWRLKNAGYQIWVEPASTVFHLGGGTLDKSNPMKTFYNYRNSLAMVFKNLPYRYLPLNIIIRLILDGISGLRLLLKGQIADTMAIIKAHFSFYFMIPNLIKKRGSSFTDVNYIYSRNIIEQYFLYGRKKFSDLSKINNYVESWTYRWNRGRKKHSS